MNANELADELWEKYLDNNECQHGYALSSGCSNDDCKEQALYDASNMLRQFGLAESIIKQQQIEIEALRNQLWDLKSEPWGFDRHPVKELTDEEIVRISKTCDLNHVLGLIDFARAILRKAQEK